MADVSKIKLGSTTYNIKDSSAVHGTVSTGDSVTVTKGDSVTVGTPFTVPNVTSVGSVPTLGTPITADDITEWIENVPTAVTPNTVVTTVNPVWITYDTTNERILFPEYVLNGDIEQYAFGDSATVTAGTAASLSRIERTIPNVTSVGSAPTLGTAFTIPNISKKQVVTDVTKKTVVTGIS